jgi:hypothetical protein
MARRTRADITIPAGTDVTGMEDLIFGGPGVALDAPPPAAPAAPAAQPRGAAMKEVVINGAKYLVPEEQAAALEAQQVAIETQFQSLRSELDGLKKPAAPAAAPPAADSDDFETKFFLDPKGTLARVKDEWKQEIRQEYTVAQAQAKWWDDFYGSHKHLKGSNVIVEAVMRAHFDELKALPVDKQAAALAGKVDAELARIVKSAPRAEPNAPAPRPVEGASPVRGGPSPMVDDDRPADRVISISEIHRKQRQRRLEARTGRSAS